MSKLCARLLFIPLLIISTDSFADKIENTGTALQIIIPAVALGSTLTYEKNTGHDGTRQFAKSLATTLITTAALKEITHKKRPNGSNYKSFPSGHTSAAFMGAAFIHKRYGFKKAILPYIGATYVAYSRVHAKKHDTIDVIAGAAVGILSSRYFTTPYKKLSVSPVVENGGLGVQLTKRW